MIYGFAKSMRYITEVQLTKPTPFLKDLQSFIYLKTAIKYPSLNFCNQISSFLHTVLPLERGNKLMKGWKTQLIGYGRVVWHPRGRGKLSRSKVVEKYDG